MLYHSLQVYSLASDALFYDEELRLAALLHDVGKGIDPYEPIAAGLQALGDSISQRTSWLIEHHELAVTRSKVASAFAAEATARSGELRRGDPARQVRSRRTCAGRPSARTGSSAERSARVGLRQRLIAIAARYFVLAGRATVVRDAVARGPSVLSSTFFLAIWRAVATVGGRL